MTSARRISEAELAIEIEARGFEPTDVYTDSGRFWRKKGRIRGPIPHLLVPMPFQGEYTEDVVLELRRRIRQINDWVRPRLVRDRDEPEN